MNGRIQVKKTEQHASTLPEIGKVKIGEKHAEKGYPMSLDYFRATGNYAEQFKQLYGDKPNKLTIAFISDDLAEVCNERYESWDKGKRNGWGDGSVFTVYDTTEKKYVENVPADDPRVRAYKWDIYLTLRFVLLEMKGILGYWTFTTKGNKTTIPSVLKSFDFVKERAGTIVSFPFNLVVEKHKGYSPGEARNYPVVTLVPNFSEQSIEMVQTYLEAGGQINKLNSRMISEAEYKQLNSGTDGK